MHAGQHVEDVLGILPRGSLGVGRVNCMMEVNMGSG